MKKGIRKFSKSLAVITTFSVLLGGSFQTRAEEYNDDRRSGNYNPYADEYDYQDPDENYWDAEYDDYSSYDSYDDDYGSGGYGDYGEYEGFEDYSDSITIEEPEEPAVPGTYTVASGWSEDEAQSTDSTVVYRQDAFSDADPTSVISCSYLDTNYSVSEYEQLRDMLISNLLYDNVNAQISTSAVYTQAKDYLYMIAVDDPAEAYRDIYHYVVGDYICFCVQVRELRSEAEEDEAQERQTPQQAGYSMAESFIWN